MDALRLSTQGITIGAEQEVRINSIKVNPNLGSLFSPVKVLRDIELDTVSVRMDMMQDPVMFPTGMAVTGAVVGAAIPGPGVGRSWG